MKCEDREWKVSIQNSESRNGISKHRPESSTRSSKSNGGKIKESSAQKSYINSGMTEGLKGRHNGDRKDFRLTPSHSRGRGGSSIQNKSEADLYNDINIEHFSIEEERPPVKIFSKDEDIRSHDHQSITLTIEDVEEGNGRDSNVEIHRTRLEHTEVGLNTPFQFINPGNVDTAIADGVVEGDQKEQSFNAHLLAWFPVIVGKKQKSASCC